MNMHLIQNWWSAFKPENPEPALKAAPLIYSFQTAGTRFPILETRLGTGRWPAQKAPGAGPSIEMGIASQVGKRSNNNEDTALVFHSCIPAEDGPAPLCFAVVADGMSEHWGGEYASSIVAEVLAEYVINELIVKAAAGPSSCPDSSTIRCSLLKAMEAAHDMIRFYLPGSGTTATCALLIGDKAEIAHIGDSRAYVMTDGKLQLLTEDHSLTHFLDSENGQDLAQGGIHASRGVLYRAVGMDGNLMVDTLSQRLAPASILLLCSAGLWGALGDPRIEETIIRWGDPQTVCDRLVTAGAQAARSDNVTAVVLQLNDTAITYH